MFMRNNRATNKAEQPEKSAASDAAQQKKAQQLDPNYDIPGPAEDWRFMPSMSTPAQINEGHYQGGISGAGVYGTSYEAKIPYVGIKDHDDSGDRKLTSR